MLFFNKKISHEYIDIKQINCVIYVWLYPMLVNEMTEVTLYISSYKVGK